LIFFTSLLKATDNDGGQIITASVSLSATMRRARFDNPKNAALLFTSCIVHQNFALHPFFSFFYFVLCFVVFIGSEMSDFRSDEMKTMCRMFLF